jgi:hypothetical protein
MATRGKSTRGGSTTRKSDSRPAASSSSRNTYTYSRPDYVARAKTAASGLYNRASSAVRDTVSGVRDAVDVYGNIGRTLDKVSGR